jgi:isoquinoline 1-oxidoreductase beta subunit
MNHTRKVTRREFVQSGGLLVLGVSLAGCGRGEGTPVEMAEQAAETITEPWSPDVYLSFDADGTVHIIAHRVEMGQGIRTGLPAIVADELEADWDRVNVVQGMADQKYGDQNTDGSHSVRDFLHRLREAGATARTMLEQAAAQQWQVDVAGCRADMHRVVHEASGREIDYKDLLATASGLEVPAPESLKLKDPENFRYIGKGLSIVDMHDMTHGTAIFGSDASLPGMKFATVARCPVLFGKARSFNADAALNFAGVEKVLELPYAEPPAMFKALGGIAVIADNSWSALQGRELLEIDWDEGANAAYDSETYRDALFDAVRQPGIVVRGEGDVEQALTVAERTLEAEYYTPHLAHAPMEPPHALANVTADGCEIWAPVQNPQSAQQEAAAICGLEPDQVKVHVTLLGGAFGRKSKCDFVNEAVLLSKELGVPVKVLWSREDDIRHDYLHSVAAQSLAAGLDADGKVNAWRHRASYPTIFSTFDPSANAPVPMEMGLGAITMPYAIDNVSVEAGAAECMVRIGWLRSVCNIFQAFSICAFTDEIAEARGLDPLENVLDLIGPDRHNDFSAYEYNHPEGYPYDTARLRHVAEKAAELADWGRSVPDGHGLGLAVHYSFYSYLASVVEVAVDGNGGWHVPKVFTAIDCGLAVNPDRVRAQMEGSAVFGLSLARSGNITAAGGRIEQGNFDDYPMIRINQAPVTGVHIVKSNEAPAGAGEPGVPPIAPALVNAIFAATGKRFRELPLGDKLAL